MLVVFDTGSWKQFEFISFGSQGIALSINIPKAEDSLCTVKWQKNLPATQAVIKHEKTPDMNARIATFFEQHYCDESI